MVFTCVCGGGFIDRSFLDCLSLGRCCLVLESLYFWLRVDQRMQCLLFVCDDNAVLWNGMQVKRPSAAAQEQRTSALWVVVVGHTVSLLFLINASRQAVPSSCLFVLLLPARIRVRSRTRSKDKKKAPTGYLNGVIADLAGSTIT